jgi:uncharacterized protein YgiM (DUF1202 family)
VENEEKLQEEHKKAIKLMAVMMALVMAMMLTLPGSAFAYTQYERIVANGHGSLNASYLVIHETANPGASDDNHVTYWSNNPAYAVHYVMDVDGSSVFHTMADNRKAWHVGNGNAYTVGIELCHATNQADFNKQWTEAVKWAGDYLHNKGWGIDRLISHNEAALRWGGSDHTDPVGYFAQYGKSWSQFEAAVAAYMQTGEVGNGGSVNQGGGGTAVSGSGGGSYVSPGTYTVTASALNVRTGPGVNYAKKSYSQLTANAKAHAYSNGCLKNGTRVTVYECTNGWARIPSGWVSTAYLSKAGSSSVSTAKSGTYVVDVNTRLNVRTGPGTNYRITGTLSDGYTLYNVTISNGWGKYQAYTGTRYVSAQYLDAA